MNILLHAIQRWTKDNTRKCIDGITMKSKSILHVFVFGLRWLFWPWKENAIMIFIDT